MPQEIHLAHTPPDLPIFVALYAEVENAPFLKEQLLAGNSDFEYAFIDASMVRLDLFELASRETLPRLIWHSADGRVKRWSPRSTC